MGLGYRCVMGLTGAYSAIQENALILSQSDIKLLSIIPVYGLTFYLAKCYPEVPIRGGRRVPDRFSF